MSWASRRTASLTAAHCAGWRPRWRASAFVRVALPRSSRAQKGRFEFSVRGLTTAPTQTGSCVGRCCSIWNIGEIKHAELFLVLFVIPHINPRIWFMIIYMESEVLKSACGAIDLTVIMLPVITWTVHLFRFDWLNACGLEGYLSIFAQSCKCINTLIRSSVSFLLMLPDRLKTILKIMIFTVCTNKVMTSTRHWR